MTLAIAGIGMVSPAGIVPRDHVFFTRAGVLTPAPSPFLDAQGKRVEVRHCPWIGARVTVGERMSRMAEIAVHAAVSSFEEARPDEPIPFLLCAAAARPGLSPTDIAEVEQTLKRRLRSTAGPRFHGEAGVFEALRHAETMVSTPRGAGAAVIIGVDSYVAIDALIEHVRRPPSYWSDDIPDPSEGAAALLVLPHPAPRTTPALATLHGAALAPDTATDENDEIIDGTGLTTALRALRAPGPIGLVVGQEKVDELRRREWHLASARNPGRFHAACGQETLEQHIGRVGAASGAMSIAYGVALSMHQAVANPALRGAPFLAWAISRDGVRGAAVAQGRSQ